MKHYEFTGETIEWLGRKLRRIRRLSDGQLGCWVESETNLAQGGDAWIGGEAKVWGEACKLVRPLTMQLVEEKSG